MPRNNWGTIENISNYHRFFRQDGVRRYYPIPKSGRLPNIDHEIPEFPPNCTISIDGRDWPATRLICPSDPSKYMILRQKTLMPKEMFKGMPIDTQTYAESQHFGIGSVIDYNDIPLSKQPVTKQIVPKALTYDHHLPVSRRKESHRNSQKKPLLEYNKQEDNRCLPKSTDYVNDPQFEPNYVIHYEVEEDDQHQDEDRCNVKRSTNEMYTKGDEYMEPIYVIKYHDTPEGTTESQGADNCHSLD